MNLQKSFNVALAQREMKQKDLAEKMKCTTPYINKIIQGGGISIRKLQEVCTALDIKVWEFVKLGEE